jgi:hypothetical protein
LIDIAEWFPFSSRLSLTSCSLPIPNSSKSEEGLPFELKNLPKHIDFSDSRAYINGSSFKAFSLVMDIVLQGVANEAAMTAIRRYQGTVSSIHRVPLVSSFFSLTHTAFYLQLYPTTTNNNNNPIVDVLKLVRTREVLPTTVDDGFTAINKFLEAAQTAGIDVRYLLRFHASHYRTPVHPLS